MIAPSAIIFDFNGTIRRRAAAGAPVCPDLRRDRDRGHRAAVLRGVRRVLRPRDLRRRHCSSRPRRRHRAGRPAPAAPYRPLPAGGGRAVAGQAGGRGVRPPGGRAGAGRDRVRGRPRRGRGGARVGRATPVVPGAGLLRMCAGQAPPEGYVTALRPLCVLQTGAFEPPSVLALRGLGAGGGGGAGPPVMRCIAISGTAPAAERAVGRGGGERSCPSLTGRGQPADLCEGRSHETREARAVVIGGGVGGCSILYHLAKLGWDDVVLVEQYGLTHGSTWHSAGLVGQLRSASA